MARYRSRRTTGIATITLLLIALVPAVDHAAVPTTTAPATKMIRPDILWSRPLKKMQSLGRGVYQYTQPILHDGVLYIGSATGGVFAFTTDGKPQWMTATDGAVYAPVRVAAETVYAADSEGTVYAFDRADGTKRWRTSVGGEVMTRPLVVEHTLYVVTTSGQLVALESATGIPRWHTNERLVITEFSVRGSADPVFHQGHIVVGYADGRLTAHSPSNGDIVWEERITRRTAPLHDVDATPTPAGDRLITASIGNGLAAVDGKSGRLHWFAPIGSPNSVTVAGDTYYVAGGGDVTAVAATAGTTQWKQALPSNISETSAPAVVGDTVVVFATDGPALLLDRHSGALVGSREIGRGTYGRPTVDGDRVYVVTNGNRVLALRIP